MLSDPYLKQEILLFYIPPPLVLQQYWSTSFYTYIHQHPRLGVGFKTKLLSSPQIGLYF